MSRKIPFIFVGIFLICFLFPFSAYALPGDADGNGSIDIEDARIIARFVANQIPTLPNPDDADATQDGKVDMEDAFIIAKWVTGETRIVVVAPRYGPPEPLRLGEMIRVEVFEKFFPLNITGGTVRIRSVSTGYDSGDQILTFENDGRSLYYHWNTAGLAPASDYEITANLTDSSGFSVYAARTSAEAAQEVSQSGVVVSLTNEVFKLPYLAVAVDAYAPAPGIPLEFRRHAPNNAPAYPYLGPLGRGWFHNYDLTLEEYTDGRIALRNRIFQSNADGTYTSSPGDYGILTRDSDGTFQLKEKNGLVYRFRSDLRFDYKEDLNGNRISAIYNSANQLVEIRHSAGQSFFLEYNDAGRIIRLTDHVGRVTTYEYNSPYPTSKNFIISPNDYSLLARVTDPALAVTQYTYSFGLHDSDTSGISDFRLLSVAHPDGTYVHYEHDSRARLVKQTGTWGANPTTYQYDEDGKTHITDAAGGETVISVNDRGQPLTIISPDNAQTQMQYNTSANLTQVSDPLEHVTKMGYDEFGNMTWLANPLGETIQYGYDLRFNKVSNVTNPLNKTTSFTYDNDGNLSVITFPDPQQSQISFTHDSQGNLTVLKDAAQKTTEFSYNAQGQVTNIRNALQHDTRLAYHDTGNLKSVIDAKSHAITYDRDLLDRLTQRTYPDNSHEDYEYNAAGKVTVITNRRGERILFSYDNTGRLEFKTYPSGKKLLFHYDSRGLLSSVEKESGEQISLDAYYEHDLSRHLTLAKVPGKVETESYDVSYSYDKADNRKVMVYPDGYKLNYEYDAANRLKRISDKDNNTIVEYYYDAAGRREQRILGNGTYATYAYDDLDRLTKLTNHAPDGIIQSQFEYTYNAAGIRKTMTTLEGVHSYTYDDIYQLTGVEYPDGKVADYVFDEVGNRKTVTDNGTVTNYQTNELNQYTQAGSETFAHDDNGNLETRTSGTEIATYTWDEDDRLVGVDRAGIYIDYRYDYQGRLVAKAIDGQETRYIWDEVDLIAEMDSNGQVVKRYVYGSRIDEILIVNAAGANHWVQQDGLGSAVGTTNDSCGLIATSSYDVYGNLRNGGLGAVPQRLAGMLWDEDAGLYYVRARWYDPILCRFLSTDPVEQFGTTNYAYVHNNPANYIDPLGLKWRWDRALENVGNSGQVIRDFWWGAAIGATSVGYAGYVGGSFLGTPLVGGPIGALGGAIAGYLWGGPMGVLSGMGKRFIEGGLGIGTEGGECPTFIQPPPPSNAKPSVPQQSQHDIIQEELAAQLMVPVDNALLRSDIPIFGMAGGKNFKVYRVEYCESIAANEWHLIESSTTPQPTNNIGLAEMRLMQGDLDLRGNLATWNTGLKNWVHLPWHPAEDPTDFNGIYTIRLVVEGKDGATVEDRVTCEVGRVIAQCLPGIAVSPDKTVTMRFPEQSLTHPFRVYTILPFSDIAEDNPSLPKHHEFVGPVYRIREPGDRFIKDVSLEFAANIDELGKRKPKNIGIGRFDSARNEWDMLETVYDKELHVFKTTISKLHSPKAVYALIYNRKQKLSSSAPIDLKPLAPLKPVQAGVLIDNTFEKDMGAFKTRDRIVGATLFRDNKATPDGSYCLKFVNQNFGGNFSATILDRPFDVREFGTMSFDYRIGTQTKIDFLLKVNGRWLNLRFTGDTVDYCQRDVNIANMGAIGGIIPDDKWHTASIDLRYLLRQQTHHTQVDEIVMANWGVGGYMKLEFGNNPRGATYYIDNFKLAGPGRVQKKPPVLLVDDFNEVKSKNNLGRAFGTYSTPGSNCFKDSSIDVVPEAGGSAQKASDTRNRALLLTFDTTKPDSYGGYWTSIAGSDLSEYLTLAFRMRTDGDVPAVTVGIRNRHGVEGKTDLRQYASAPDANGWRDVRIPLSGLRGLSDFSSPDVLFFSTTYKNKSGKGSMKIDNLQFEQKPFMTVTDFESTFDWSLLGGDFTTRENGAAAISAARLKDMNNPDNTVLRISYGGTIGRDYGLNGGFSYAGWQAGLNGIDAREFTNMVMRIRGEDGGETPNIYLADPAKRIPLRAQEIPEIKKEWQTVRLPLDHYARQGIDLSHIDSMEIVFEWEKQSGTIYIDGIRFE